MRVGVDLDGCLYDFGSSLSYYLINYEGFPEELCNAPKVWNFFLEWGLTLEEYLAAYARGVDAGVVLRVGKPDTDCIKVLSELKDAGHTLHIVTYRTVGKKAIQNTSEWLDEWGVPFDSITFSKDKTIVKNDVFIEDNMDNFKALWEADIACYLMDRPWNRELSTRYRVYGWRDFGYEVMYYDK